MNEPLATENTAAPAAPIATTADLKTNNLPTLAAAAAGKANDGVLRFTNSVATYDLSPGNPEALANLGKALASNLSHADITFIDPESSGQRKLSDVLTAVDLTTYNDMIVLKHRDTAGKGILGSIAESVAYIASNPFSFVCMKVFSMVADPEVVYKQRVVQLLAELDNRGSFGPPGQSTFDLNDWEIDTSVFWRDVIIKRKGQPVVIDQTFGDAVRNSFKIGEC